MDLLKFSEALKNAVDARFLATEHATALFKLALRQNGYELPKKEKTEEKK